MKEKELKKKLKEAIIEELNLEGLTPDEFDDNMSLFDGSGLALDSIDALEIIVILETEYGVKFSEATEARPHLRSINTLAKCINEFKKSN